MNAGKWPHGLAGRWRQVAGAAELDDARQLVGTHGRDASTVEVGASGGGGGCRSGVAGERLRGGAGQGSGRPGSWSMDSIPFGPAFGLSGLARQENRPIFDVS